MNQMNFDAQVLQSELPVLVEAQKVGALSKSPLKAFIELNL
jgi:hypothetical protein